MDYPFYIRRIGSVSNELLANLQQAYTNHKEFALAPGFTPQFGLQQPVDFDLGATGTKLLEELSQWFEPTTCVQTKYNVMPPGKGLGEHSDLDGYGNNEYTMYSCFAHHRVHIPLITNPQVEFWHRRTRKLPSERQPTLEVGGVYLYNDYVLHSVVNKGDATRVHVVLKFADPKHVVKRKLLLQSGVKIGEYYELP